MTRMSTQLHAVTLLPHFALLFGLTLVTPIAADDQNTAPASLQLSEDVRQEFDRRDVRKIRFVGNSSVSAEEIHAALSIDEIVQSFRSASPDPTDDDHQPWSDYTQIVAERVQKGYRNGGYLDAKVSVQSAADGQSLTLTIEEGQRYKNGPLRIVGATADLEQQLRADMTAAADGQDSSPTGNSHTRWEIGAEVSSFETAAARTEYRILQALKSRGYEFCKATAHLTPNKVDKTVDLQIDVIPGGQTTIGGVEIHGVSESSAKIALQMIDIAPGAVASQDQRRITEKALLADGRFSWVKSWCDAPFGPDQAVIMHVVLRELTTESAWTPPEPMRQSITHFARWLEQWPNGKEDMLLEGTVDFAKYSSMKNTANAEDDSSGPEALPFAPLLWLPVSRLEYRLVITPDCEFVLRLKMFAPDDVSLIDHSVVYTGTRASLVSHARKTIWSFAPSAEEVLPSLRLGVLWRGLPEAEPGQSKHRASLKLPFQMTRDDNFSPQIKFVMTPAILISLIEKWGESQNAEPPEFSTEKDDEGNVVHSLQGTGGKIALDGASGRPQAINVRSEIFESTLQVQSQMLQAELQTLQQTTEDWPNAWRPDQTWLTLTRFVADECSHVYKAGGQTLWTVIARVMRRPEVAAQVVRASRNFGRDFLFRIPPTPTPKSSPAVPQHFLYLQAATPNDSMLHRATLAYAAMETGLGKDALSTLFMEVLSDESYGPLECMLVAWPSKERGSRARGLAAVIGQRRLSTEHFVENMEKLLAPDELLGATVHGLIQELRALTPGEAEEFARVLAQVKQTINGSTLTIGEPAAKLLVTAIRSHADAPSDEILRDVLAALWVAGLRAKTEAQLTAWIPRRSPASKFKFASESKKTAVKSDKPWLAPIELPQANESTYQLTNPFAKKPLKPKKR